MPKVLSYEVREEFFELVCGGLSLQQAGELLGVSRETAATVVAILGAYES